MNYGLCPLSIVPVRESAADTSELVTQILYGEHFKVLESRAKWSKIRLEWDGYEGWIDNKQWFQIDKEQYDALTNQPEVLTADLVDFITNEAGQLMPVPIGSCVHSTQLLDHSHEGNTTSGTVDKAHLVNTALLYLNSPYLWGGKTPFGIDCSGFTQMVYRLNGYRLKRDASQQATQGDAFSFIEECEPGDLAFFDNKDGDIIHVGIVLKDNYIIHAHGQVRIDRLDHTGIFNAERNTHTHKLRVLKRIV
ncbi:NlpC/P60 family protein [Gilvibacter sp.]|uniref:C40 family peptidase n=1 Tax=Gilvibacter sp. TaxID=2729997 RepID=UPI003F49ECB3